MKSVFFIGCCWSKCFYANIKVWNLSSLDNVLTKYDDALIERRNIIGTYENIRCVGYFMGKQACL